MLMGSHCVWFCVTVVVEVSLQMHTERGELADDRVHIIFSTYYSVSIYSRSAA